MNTVFHSMIRGPLLVCCFVSLLLGSEAGRTQEMPTVPTPPAIEADASANDAASSTKQLLKVIDENKQQTVEIVEDGDKLIIRKTVDGEEKEVVIEADSIAGSIAFGVLEELAAEGILDDEETLLDLAELSGEGIKIKVENESEDTSFGEMVIGFMAVTLLLGTPIMIVGAVLYSRYRRRKLLHESMNRLIDSGREIPDNLFNEIEGGNDQNATLRKGMTSTGAGIAIIICLSLIADPKVGSLGLIPLMIGLAHLAIWKINKGQSAS